MCPEKQHLPRLKRKSPIHEAQERASVSGIALVQANIGPGLAYRWIEPYLMVPEHVDNDTAMDILIRFFRHVVKPETEGVTAV